jgi:hypothetical protein
MQTRSTLLRMMVAAVILSTAGCAATTAQAGDGAVMREDLPLIQRSAEQKAAIADGVITRAEYTSGFDRFTACLKRAGFEVVSVRETGNLIEYSVPADAVATGDDDRCYRGEFVEIDRGWQLAHEDESSTTRMYQACLDANGVPASTSAEEVWKQMERHGLDEKICLEYADEVE